MRAVCVTGMHRSGTSIVARALNLLGVSLGDPDHLMPPGGDNPAGYWENRFIKELDDELLAHLGGGWDEPPVLDPGWEHAGDLDPFRARAADVLRNSFAAHDEDDRLVAWKDPRLSLLLPFWRTVVPITATIVVVRDPREVAASLYHRNGVGAPSAALLWLRYLLAATADDPNHLLVYYDDVVRDLPGLLTAMTGHLGLASPTAEVEAAVRDHLDPALRHHVASNLPPADANPLVELASIVWSAGGLELTAIPEVVSDGLRRGWLRPPMDRAELAHARAEVALLTVRLRRQRRTEAARATTGEDDQ
jgi:hypothetical protein